MVMVMVLQSIAYGMKSSDSGVAKVRVIVLK
jgi:hypothetical protein